MMNFFAKKHIAVVMISGFLMASGLLAQSPELVRNLHSGPGLAGIPRYPDHLTAIGDTTYLTLQDPQHGTELWSWRPGETPTLAADLIPGLMGLDRAAVVKLGNDLVVLSNGRIFRFVEGIQGAGELALPPGLQITSTRPGVMGNQLFFGATDSTLGPGLWVSTNFEPPTLLTELPLLPSTGIYDSYQQAGNKLFFWAMINGSLTLYLTDGTPQGTRSVNFPGNGTSFQIDLFQALEDRVIFNIYTFSRWQLWASDGDETIMITENSRDSQNSMTFNGYLYFHIYVSNTYELWRTDGTGVVSLASMPRTGGIIPRFLGVTTDRLFFSGITNAQGTELWSTDGSTLERFADLAPDPANALFLRNSGAFGDRMYIFRGNGESGDLYSSDGTAAGTWLIPNTGLANPKFMNHGNRMTLLDGGDADRLKFYTYDGVDLVFQTDISQSEDASTHISDMTQAGGRLFFTNRSNLNEPGEGLWVSEGEAWNTRQISDLRVQKIYAAGARPVLELLRPLENASLFLLDENDQLEELDLEYGIPINEAISTPDHLIFVKNHHLYGSDGTLEGTLLLSDRYFNSLYLGPQHAIVLDGLLYFLYQQDLWRTDGTPAGTEILVPSLTSSTGLAAFNHELYFQKWLVNRLWLMKVDANGQNPTPIGALDEDFGPVAVLPDGLTFISDGKLKKTDGQGIQHMVSLPDRVTDALWLEVLNPQTLLLGLTTPEGFEIWRTRGSDADTYHLITTTENVLDYAMLDGVLYFRNTDEMGTELWRSNGTLPGTYRLEDLATGFRSSRPMNFTRAGSQLYFSAWTPETGRELYRLCAVTEPVITSQTELCNGAGAYLAGVNDAGPGTTIEWSLVNATLQTGQGTRHISFLPDGNGPVTLAVSLTTPGRCTSLASLELPLRTQVPAQPSLIVGPELVCSGAQNQAYGVDADPDTSAFLWTAPAGSVIIAGQGTNQVLVNFGSQGGFLSVTPENACGQGTTRQLNLTLTESPNQADAGPDQDLCSNQTTLAGNLPNAGNSGNWTIKSGIGGLLAEPGNPHSAFQGLVGEAYQLEWTINSVACGQTRDLVWILFRQPPSQANAGPDQVLCQKTGRTRAVVPVIGTGHWEVVSATGPIQLSNSNIASTDFSGEFNNTYVLRWVVSNGGCGETSDTVTIRINQPPPFDLSAGEDQILTIGDTAQLEATQGWPGVWSVASGPSLSTDQFSNLNDPLATFTPLGGMGVYRLYWQVNVGCSSPSTADVYLYFDLPSRTPHQVRDPAGLHLEFLNSMPFNGALIGQANHPELGPSLWSVDGSGQNARLLYRLTGYQQDLHSLDVLDGYLYFSMGNSNGWELWRTNGTPLGTENFREISGTGAYNPGYAATLGNYLYFRGSENGQTGLWRTDGNDISLVNDPSIGLLYPANLTVMNGALYFSGTTQSASSQLWRSDGTAKGTFKLSTESGQEPTAARSLTAVGNRLFFVANTDDAGTELWVTDGTNPGTIRLTDLNPGTASSGFINLSAFADKLFFGARGLPSEPYLASLSDGTPESTTPLGNGLSPSGDPVMSGPYHYLPASLNGVFGLYKIDTALLQTSLVSSEMSSINELTLLGSMLYFRGYQSTPGYRMWRSDGTAAGTTRMENLIPGAPGDFPNNLKAVGSSLFFNVHQKTWYLNPETETGATLTAPPQLCSFSVFNRAVLEDLPAGATLHWHIANGQITSDQGSPLLEFQAGRDGVTVLAAEVDLADGGHLTKELVIPVLGTNYDAWNQGPGPFDLDQNQHTDIRDLIQIGRACH